MYSFTEVIENLGEEAARLSWKDVSTEASRRYYFAGGEEYEIFFPVALAISKSGAHRLVDADGRSHYIKCDYIAFSFVAKENCAFWMF